jgi:hypothetical protein
MLKELTNQSHSSRTHRPHPPTAQRRERKIQAEIYFGKMEKALT